MKVKWVNDPRAESGLRRLGVNHFDIMTVKISDIDKDISHDRQARIGKKVEEGVVLEYAQLMASGSAFFMPILNKLGGKGRDRYFIWSGNHRIPAAELVEEGKDAEIKAYVVNVKDLRIMDILPRIVNTWEGRRESREAILEHCKYIIEKYGYEPKEVATMFGVDDAWLYPYLRAGTVARKIEETGIKGAGDLVRSTLIMLSPLADSQPVLRNTVKLIKAYDIKGTEVKQFIDDVKAQTSDNAKLGQVAHWERIMLARKRGRSIAAPAPTSNGSPKVVRPLKEKPIELTANNRHRTITLITRLDKFLQGIDAATQLQLDPADVKIVTEAWDRIARKMTKLMKE